MPVFEKPLYILPQLKKRAVIPQVFSLISLSLIFYLGILINLALLDTTKRQEELAKLFSIILIIGLSVFGLIISVLRAKKKYVFYKNRITFGKKQIFYDQIVNTAPGRNFKDKIFKTYNIKLNESFIIKHIPTNINITDYIKKLITYSSRTIS